MNKSATTCEQQGRSIVEMWDTLFALNILRNRMRKSLKNSYVASMISSSCCRRSSLACWNGDVLRTCLAIWTKTS